VGILAASVLCPFFRPGVWMTVILMIPMVADGFIQLRSRYESTNFRRVVTGTLFGYGFWTLFLLSSIYVFQLGYNMVRK
jgi:uncharacterized membrane protein